MKKIINYLFQGLLYTAPFGITAYIIYLIYNFIDNLLADTIEEYLSINIPGLSVIIIFVFLVVVGIIGQSIIAKPIKQLFNRLLEKVPFLKLIYSALNDLLSAFVGKERKFNKPVIVLVNPISNLEKLGFLTAEDLRKLDEKDKVAVYFPNSYSLMGELFIVPTKQVRTLDINPAIVMKFIVSGGVSNIYEEKEIENEKK